MVRALRAQRPAVRSAFGRSLGPITTSATAPISASSDQLKLNIADHRHTHSRPLPLSGRITFPTKPLLAMSYVRCGKNTSAATGSWQKRLLLATPRRLRSPHFASPVLADASRILQLIARRARRLDDLAQ